MSQKFYFYAVNAATTIKGRQLFKGGNYSRKYSNCKCIFSCLIFFSFCYMEDGGVDILDRYQCYRQSAAQDGPNGRIFSTSSFFIFWFIKTWCTSNLESKIVFKSGLNILLLFSCSFKLRIFWRQTSFENFKETYHSRNILDSRTTRQ